MKSVHAKPIGLILVCIVMISVVVISFFLMAMSKEIFAIVFTIVFVVGASVCWIILLLMKAKEDVDEEDECLQLPGVPQRYTFETLKSATENFRKVLGKGGFGTVFEGRLPDGERIAVKCLQDCSGQGKKEFVAEVETIGSIHHFNLVRMLGFCVYKSRRFLVYECMCNGSLDKWIFYKDPTQPPLPWQNRKEIIVDVAKGLAYLHEGCRHKIIHLDIKPQNILLDTDMHAKISDFGLSKSVQRDQSQVLTKPRGTCGYMAPELSDTSITEKVDVYSFGIVVIEVVCGRKNLDSMNDGEDLLPIIMRKAESGDFVDIVDKQIGDLESEMREAAGMMMLAVWCLQRDSSRRPSMSTIVKLLEGTGSVKVDLDYSIHERAIAILPGFGTQTLLSPDQLSGPR